jgi:threonine dehydratase
VIPEPALTPGAIRTARASIDPAFLDSPQYVHDGLSARLGFPVIVKVETVNPIRSFKGRGTSVAIRALAGEGRIGPERPIACVSAGNFGQGVAHAARALGIPAIVFTSNHANPRKIGRMRALGAEVIGVGEDFDTARAASETYAAAHPVELLVDGEDPQIAAGAATLAQEVTDDIAAGRLPMPVLASIPVGNGALINGVGSWLRATAPGCRIVGIQAERADAMARSFAAGRPIDTDAADTYADGIATRVSIPRAVTLMTGRVDEMRTVSEAALHDSQTLLTDELGITVEGAAAATWAGLLVGRPPDGPVLLVITGSNV